jgi:protein-S-isoprenylcysteine O-methyltransferase Ste14
MRLSDFALLPVIARVLVALGYLGFFVFFGVMKRHGSETVVKRDRASTFGIVLQMLGFALVWMIQRRLPLAGATLGTREVVLDVLAPMLSIVSAWIGLSAVRTLGKQWSYQARLVEGHQLVVEGPYRFVRHPIYTAMFGKLLAANFAFGHWLGLLVGGAVFLTGTLIRTHSEEKLLRGQFGEQYEAYAQRVRALVPGVL